MKLKTKRIFILLLLFIVLCVVTILILLIFLTNEIGIANDKFVPSRDADYFVDDDMYTSISDESHIIIDENTGYGRLFDNELIIYAEDNTSKDQINELILLDDGSIVGTMHSIDYFHIRFDKSYSYNELKNIKEKYENASYVESVSYNRVVQSPQTCYYPITDNENDRWRKDWDSIPTGVNWGVEAIKAPEAWEYVDLMQDVNVGVFDSGFDITHEDLKDRIVQYFTHIDNTNLDHGTHVTGIIGANFNNEIGIYGVSPTAKLSLIDCHVSEDLSELYSTDLYSFAYTFLIEKCNCKVINMSLNIGSDLIIYGASQGNKNAQKEINDTAEELSKTLNKLLENKREFVICAGAGNTNDIKFVKDSSFIDRENNMSVNYGYRFADSSDKKSTIESKYVDAFWCSPLTAIKNKDLKNRIIIVGAIKNESDKTAKYSMCDFSNVGNRVDVVAPGYDIESTVSTNGYEWQYTNKYGNKSSWRGTSMATPHVAGIAAMLYSLDSDLTGEEVKRIICETATTEVDGYKLVDAEAAVKKVMGQGSLSGEVVSSDNNSGLCNVRVDFYLKLKSGTQYIDNVYTSDKGYFSIDLQGGSYEIRFNKDGYKTTVETITISKDVITFLQDPIIMEKQYEPSIFEQIPKVYSGHTDWGTVINFNNDGSFQGKFIGLNKEDVGSNYPQGTIYIREFSGKCSEPKRIDQYTYSTKLESSLELVGGANGEEYYEDGVRYIYCNPVGFEKADEFYIYFPGIKITDLPEELVSMYHLTFQVSDTLQYYTIYSISDNSGLLAYNPN